MLNPIVKRVAGIDVHKAIIVVTTIIEHQDGTLAEETREFGTFADDYYQLTTWLLESQIELIIMESTGIYWKKLYSILEESNLNIYGVNARHVNKVPGRKTDVQDSQWLATLGRFGLLKASFIPPQDLRELRNVARYRTKLSNTLAGEKNRLHKLLDTVGLRLGNVVSDIDGVSAKRIIKGIIDGESVDNLVLHLKGQLKKKEAAVRKALAVKLSSRDLFLLKKIYEHIEYIQAELLEIDNYLLTAMQSYKQQWEILQTIPGISEISAAMIIIETGVNMEKFSNKDSIASWAGMCPGNNESAGKKKWEDQER